MDKKFFKQCIQEEVYGQYKKAKNRLNFFDKIWCKFLSPQTNAVYLIRKKELYESGGGLKRLIARLIFLKLIRRYGVHVGKGVTIDIGLTIPHPIGIVIGASHIGKNFKILQNCTIGTKRVNSRLFPTIGDNVTMFTGSMIIGDIKVADNIVLGANSTLLSDAKTAGVYIGTPARLISADKE